MNVNCMNLNMNRLNSNYLRKTNTSYSSDDGINSLSSSASSLFMMKNKNNNNRLSNSNSSQHKLNDLYKSHLSGSSSSLSSYSSNENSVKDDRLSSSQSSKQNMMYQEQRFPFDLSRYKTELCRAYEEQKNCVYGDRCMFAHGHWELKRPINRHPKYKTQKCVAFEEQGICMFGTRCSFLHEKIGSAEDIIDAILRLNKQTFQMPENPNKKSNLDLNRLDTINEQESLAKSIDGMEQRAQFISSLSDEHLFDSWTSKPAFDYHHRSPNNAYKNIVRLDCLNEYVDKDKLLPDITSLLVDDHANLNSLFFNDGANGSYRLPIFEKISANTNPLEMSTNESQSAFYQINQNLMDALNSSNNSSKSSESTNSFNSASSSSSSSAMSLCSSSSDNKSTDFEIEKYF